MIQILLITFRAIPSAQVLHLVLQEVGNHHHRSSKWVRDHRHHKACTQVDLVLSRHLDRRT